MGISKIKRKIFKKGEQIMETKRRHRYITWLLYTIVLTTIVTTITLSRYTSNVSLTGSADVASIVTIQKEIVLNPSSQVLKPGQQVKYKFGITNDDNGDISEVTQSYDIYFQTTGNLPLTYELVKNSDDGVSTDNHAVPNSGKFTYNTSTKINASPGTLNHTNSEVHYYDLIVNWPNTDNDYDDKYATEIDAITIRFEATQID